MTPLKRRRRKRKRKEEAGRERGGVFLFPPTHPPSPPPSRRLNLLFFNASRRWGRGGAVSEGRNYRPFSSRPPARSQPGGVMDSTEGEGRGEGANTALNAAKK